MSFISTKTKNDLLLVSRYTLVMGCGWLADLLVFAIAVDSLDIPLSQLLARTTGAVMGFVLHKYFTFRQTGSARSNVAVRYTLVWMFSYFLSTGLIMLLVNASLLPVGAKLMVEIMMVPVNFILLRVFVFARQR
jgi:putative flippase GtrA